MAVKARFAGVTDSAGTAGVVHVTGAARSACTSAAASARLYTRTSSISPLNHSDQIEFPPIRNAPVPTMAEPVTALLETCTPLTYMRSVVPSNVVARWVHTPAGTAEALLVLDSSGVAM